MNVCIGDNINIAAGNLWNALTSHGAVLTYAVILTISVIVIMALIIIRNARDVKSREKEKKLRQTKKRFSRLCQLDEQFPRGKAENHNAIKAGNVGAVSLERLCTDFRNYAAAAMGLYYDERTVRAYVSSLAVTKLIILEGISGTGKTSLPYAFGKFVKREAAVVPVQPSWKDKTDMLGYYNEFTNTFTETELLYKLYEANLCGDVFTVILDEMNIARVEYYFAEFLSLLELPDPSARQIEVVASRRESDPRLLKEGKLLIPENVWFVGTANNDDSTLAISDKVYDRAMVLELSRRASPFAAEDPGQTRISFAQLDSLFRNALDTYSVSAEMRRNVEELDRFLNEKMHITFGNRIMRQIEKFVPVYLAAGGPENEAVDVIVSRKVLRRLENQNPVFVEAAAGELLGRLGELFGKGTMPLCEEFISRYIRS